MVNKSFISIIDRKNVLSIIYIPDDSDPSNSKKDGDTINFLDKT